MQRVAIRSARGAGVLAATILVSGMAAFMGRTVSISLPAIQAEFGAAVSQLQWVITVYALMLATFTLISGRICDAYGIRGVFLGGIGLFGAGAVAAAASGSMAMLIASQVVLGLGGIRPWWRAERRQWQEQRCSAGPSGSLQRRLSRMASWPPAECSGPTR